MTESTRQPAEPPSAARASSRAAPAARPPISRRTVAPVSTLPAWTSLLRGDNLQRAVWGVASGLLFAGLAALEYLPGPHLDRPVFYLVPVCVGAWAVGLWFALPLALAATVLSHVTELQIIDRAGYGRLHIHFVDLMHGLMFTVAAIGTWWVRRQGDRLAAEHRRALEFQRRAEADLEAAHRVQQSLMVQQLPQVPQVDMAMAYWSAIQVGGDLVDVRRRGMRLGVCIADVSGKGAQAALMAVALKGWLDNAPGRLVSPAEVASYLNRRLCECVPVEMFVTLAYVVMNTANGELLYAIAGHEAPLLRNGSTGAIEQLDPTGPALGLIPELAFEERAITLGDGDLLLLYTDGLSTVRGPDGERRGIEPAVEILRRHGGDDLDSLVQEMFAITKPNHGDPADDVALLALRRRPEL